MVGRVSTYGLGQALTQSSLALQSRYADAVTQQSSGLVTGTYGGLGAKASSLISVETMTTQLDTWKSNASISDDRVQSMYSAVGSMIDDIQSFRTKLSGLKSATSDDIDANSVAQSLLEDLADLMNLQVDGRYLFAGSATDTAPVDLTTLPAATSPSTPNTLYYKGDTELATVRVSAQQTITYGVTADSDGFEQALRAANLIAHMSTTPLDQDTIDEAYDLLTSSLDTLISTQSALSNNADRLNSVTTRHTSTLDLLDTMASDIEDADTAEVALKVAQYQTQLEASYSALAKVTSLTLTDYLH